MPVSIVINQPRWCIYIEKIPYIEKGNFWVSFESHPRLQRTKADIYGRCLPCIQSLYRQLKDDCTEIALGTAYNCWKVTAILNGIEECLSLLNEFEKRFPVGHVYGKFGSSKSNSETRVVVFHTENEVERDRIQEALEECLPEVNRNGRVQISRACAVLYYDILGDWREWRETTTIKYPENIKGLLERIKKIIFRAELWRGSKGSNILDKININLAIVPISHSLPIWVLLSLIVLVIIKEVGLV